MRVPILATLEKNSAGGKIFPATDDQARIVLNDSDGGTKTFSADRVECRDMNAGHGSEITFWLDGIPCNSWKVTITESRLLFWNPFSKGLIGKPKEKNGKASGGNLAFKSIKKLSTFYDRIGSKVILLVCERKDGTDTAISIAANNENMKEIFDALYAAIDKWSYTYGRLNADDGEAYAKLLAQWEHLPEAVWYNPKAEIVVSPPVKNYHLVPNCRLEE